ISVEQLTLAVLAEDLAIARDDADAALPAWFDWRASPIASLTRTGDEMSIIYPNAFVPDGVRVERAWRPIKVERRLDFQLTGISPATLTPLAAAPVSVFALSTFDTDYVLVRQRDLTRAITALRTGFTVIGDAA